MDMKLPRELPFAELPGNFGGRTSLGGHLSQLVGESLPFSLQIVLWEGLALFFTYPVVKKTFAG
jgi:hypothetical protein